MLTGDLMTRTRRVTAVVNLLITGQVEGVKAQVSGGVSQTCHHFIGRIFKAWRAPAMRCRRHHTYLIVGESCVRSG